MTDRGRPTDEALLPRPRPEAPYSPPTECRCPPSLAVQHAGDDVFQHVRGWYSNGPAIQGIKASRAWAAGELVVASAQRLAQTMHSLNFAESVIVPPAERHPPRLAPLAPRQGPPPRIQGQAGLRHLPHPRPPRWPQAPCPQGCHLWCEKSRRMQEHLVHA